MKEFTVFCFAPILLREAFPAWEGGSAFAETDEGRQGLTVCTVQSLSLQGKP